MSLAVSYPSATKGDAGCVFSQWRFSGHSDENTDRGRLFVTLTVAGAVVTLNLYKDIDRTILVATGSGSAQSRVTASAPGTELLEVSVFIKVAQASEIVLFVYLAGASDLRERDDRVEGLLLETEEGFQAVLKTTTRAFLQGLASRFPPPARCIDRLAFAENASRGHQSGDPELYAQALWTLNAVGVYEVTGLQNPEDYKEWAILHSLNILWMRKIRGADGPEIGVADYYRRLAKQQWEETQPWVDLGQDTTPDRPARVRSVRIGRA